MAKPEVKINIMSKASAGLLTPCGKAEAGEMSKKTFQGMPGESGVGDAVRTWLDRMNIDPRLVVGYSVFQHVGEVPRIMLEMYFDDVPQPAETVVQKYLIGESGPEMAHPEPPIVTVLRADHEQGMHDHAPNRHCPTCVDLGWQEKKKED